jgi:tetratricopeptide (TPR) repeat protein
MAISLKTHKVLWGRAASRCAFPDCRRELVMNHSEQNDESLVGEECHMVAREARGARGKSAMSLKERNEYDNLILLCNIHHKLIDDQPDTYPVSRLKQMKADHEKWVQESLGGTTTIWNVPHPRNLLFTGREKLLEQLHDRLTTARTVALTQPQAITGLGGIGKTQVAVEYAYTYRDAYHAILWMRGSSRDTLISDFVTAANLLSLPEKNEQDQNIVVIALKQWLATHSNWLLIFDNADDLEMVLDFLPPAGKGHILLTTRTQTTGNAISGMDVEKMNREESVLLLLRRAKKLSVEDTLDQTTEKLQNAAEAIASVLDGLPLALDQAGAYIEETQCGLNEYLDLYQISRKELLKQRGGFSSDHPEPVATTWSVSFQKVGHINPAAAELLTLCSFFDPDIIPEEIITQGASELGSILEPAASNPFSFNEAIRILRNFSLVKRDSAKKVLSVHRLVQAVLKDEMAENVQRTWAERVIRTVNQIFPHSEATTWSQCQRYLSQVQVCLELSTQFAILLPEGARLFDEAGTYFQSHAQYPIAESLKKRSLAICEQEMGMEHPVTAVALNNLATLYREQGEYAQAETLYLNSLEILEQLPEVDAYTAAGAYNNLATLYRERGKYREAEQLFQKAGLIAEQYYGQQHPATISILSNLAGMYYDQGQYEQAKQLFEYTASAWQLIHGPQHPELAQAFNSLANTYHAQGLFDQAEPLMRRALEMAEQTLGPQHPLTANCLESLGQFYRDEGKYGEAESLYLQALEVRKQVQGVGHPQTARCLNNLAMLYHSQERYKEAEQLYLQVFEIRKQTYGLQHIYTAQILNNLGANYAALGAIEKAEAYHKQAIAIEEEALGLDYFGLADLYNNLAMLYYPHGQYEKAEQLLERALKLLEQTFGFQHPHVAQSLSNLGAF